jgi:hypothetical protein
MDPSNDSADSKSLLVRSKLREEFKISHGCIIDRNGRSWVLWSTSDLYAWWHSFEDQCHTPLGRKLMNACADQEEFLLHTDELLPSGWFRKATRQQKCIEDRWGVYGWGNFDLKNQTAQSMMYAPMLAGLALATYELLSDKRKKLEWHQISTNTVRFELQPDSTTLPHAPLPPQLPWSAEMRLGFEPPVVFDDLVVGVDGLLKNGESVCLFPMDAFSRLFYTCKAYPNTVSQERKSAWSTSGFNEGERSVFLMVVASMASLVNRGERPIYIENMSSWDSLIEHYLAPFGWGEPVEISTLDSEHGVRFRLASGPSLPFLAGWLVAMWERGHGKPSKFILTPNAREWVLEVDSRLAYN